MTRFASFALLSCVAVIAGCHGGTRRPEVEATPLPRAHAHNDYAHGRPLWEALDNGFCSVEADVHLIDGKLYVAHDADQVSPGRTLESLYLEPLRQRIATHGGRVYRGSDACLTLLVDIKSDPATTYPALLKMFRKYVDLLTTCDRDGRETVRAVRVVLTGNRPPTAQVAAERRRFVAVDGTLAEADQPWRVNLMPQVNADYRKLFTWRGEGEMPAAEREKLRLIVDRAHAAGRAIRFWDAPDQPRAWGELLDAGTDLINTDNLVGLRRFLLSNVRPSTTRSILTY